MPAYMSVHVYIYAHVYVCIHTDVSVVSVPSRTPHVSSEAGIVHFQARHPANSLERRKSPESCSFCFAKTRLVDRPLGIHLVSGESQSLPPPQVFSSLQAPVSLTKLSVTTVDFSGMLWKSVCLQVLCPAETTSQL